jgi:mRNA interferase MazF
VSPFAFTPWSVWFADLNPTVGHEQAGDRVVIVVGSADGLAVSRWARVVTVIPVTTRRRGLAWHVDTNLGGVPGAAMPEQIRAISVERFRRPYGDALKPDQIAAIQEVLRRLLAV